MHFAFNAAAHELTAAAGSRIDPATELFYEFTAFHMALANVWCALGPWSSIRARPEKVSCRSCYVPNTLVPCIWPGICG
jgi:hypothetical protein